MRRIAGMSVLIVVALGMLLSVTVFDPSDITKRMERYIPKPSVVSVPPPVQLDERVGAMVQGIEADEVRETLSRFASMGSRVVGYPGSEEAYRFVRDRFEEIGLEDVRTETFPVTVPVDKGARLTLETGETIPLYSLWPNGLRTPSLPAEGIGGPLIYGGGGTFRELDGKPVEGSMVLMSFDCGQHFVNPRMLGAQAIVFYGEDGVTQGEAADKFFSVSVDIPRYWVEAEHVDRLSALAKEGKHVVRVQAKMDWETVEAKNVYGWLRGTGGEGGDGVIVVEAYYDAMSVVPGIAPGAEQAAGITALLTLAERLKAYGSKVSVLFLATSGHFEGLAGINDFLYRHARKSSYFRDRMAPEDRMDFRLFVGLDLSSHGDQVASFCMGTFYNATWGTDDYRKNMLAPYAKTFSRYAEEVFSDPERHVDAIAPSKRTWRNFMPAPLGLDSEAVSFVGLPGITLATPNDVRERVDTPLDRLEKVDLEGLTLQIQTVSGLLLRAANDEGFFVDSKLELRDYGHRLDGHVYWFDRTVHFAVPKSPVQGAVVTYQQPGPNSVAGVRTLITTTTDEKGFFQFDILRNQLSNKILAYEIDEEGRIVSAPDLGQEGAATYPITQAYGWWENHMLEVVFKCSALSLFEIVDSRYLSVLDHLTVLGPDDVPPQSYGSEYVENQSTSEGKVTRAAVVYAKPGTRVKAFMSTGLFGIKYLLTNGPEEGALKSHEVDEAALEHAMGQGYGIDEVAFASKGVLFNPAYLAARDMWVLDDVRMKQLARYGVRNEKLEQLHEEARVALAEAKDHLEHRRYEAFISAARRAWGLEARGYPDVKATANDTVKGIVFYFMLLLPFAFFSERLLFGFADIRRQIGAVAGVFLLVFALLRFVHPAFKLSTSPYIIFLAFVIFAMGGVVLVLVLSKFNQEVQKMKRSASGMHEADIGRLSATSAAISLGISNLRKRKVRTALTATTLILLTFTVLSFTSIRTSLKYYRLPRDNRPPYPGALVRDRSWKGLQPSVLDYVESAFGGKALIVPRAWYISQLRTERAYLSFEVAKGKASVGPRTGYMSRSNRAQGVLRLKPSLTKASSFAHALLGMRPEEPRLMGLDRLLLGDSRWFREGERHVCILPDDMAHLVGITQHDIGRARIRMLGSEFLVIGIIDAEQFNAIKGMDDEKLTPVDTASEAAKMAKGITEDPRRTAHAPIETFIHLESSNVILVPYDYVIEVGGTLRSIAITDFRDERGSPKLEFTKDIEAFMSRVALTMFVGEGDKVTVYSSMGATSLGGLRNLMVPILIAALIVLNTMMGSVYERLREIGIYSSVGLAPSHIGALFLAEAAVFSTVGAVVGYLVGQVLTIALSSFGVLGGLSLNYSSLSAISSTLIVMATVFISTAYPAKKAADMAVPDVTRRWVFPEPEGDDWLFDFPFTVGGTEVLGICMYLTRVFESYGEGSIGDFVTEGAQFLSRPSGIPEDPIYEVMTRTWLAPYDLGISQDVRLAAIPTGEHRIYRIEVVLHRLSGDVASWKRINRGFLNVLRKRFLVWRTIPPATKESYQEEGRRTVEESSNGNAQRST